MREFPSKRHGIQPPPYVTQMITTVLAKSRTVVSHSSRVIYCVAYEQNVTQ